MPKDSVEEMADENHDSELWGEMNTVLESFLTEYNITIMTSKKRPISSVDEKDDNNLRIKFIEVFGREDSAKGKILWDFIKRKTNQLSACNIYFLEKVLGYEKTVIQLTLSGENRSKIPEKYYHVKTRRSSAYKVEHSDQHVRKFVTPLVKTMMAEINSKADDNENLKEKYILKAIDSLESNLQKKSDGRIKNNRINKSIVDSLHNYVCGITTGGTRDKFDQNFINNLAIAAYNPSGGISMSAVARALGGNRNTMRDLFGLQPLLYEQLNTLDKDEEKDEEETQALLERVEEEDFGLGEFEYNGNFVVDEDVLNKILTNNPDIDSDSDNSEYSSNFGSEMEVGKEEDDEDATAGSGAATAKTKGGNKKRDKTIFSD